MTSVPLFLYLVVPLAPLIGAALAGILGTRFLPGRFSPLIGRKAAHFIAITGVGIAALASLIIFRNTVAGEHLEVTLYEWSTVADIKFEIGFLVDNLSALMMVVVTFVSLMVHIYTIGYMSDDAGYQRFFSYISLFTFAMLMLVMSNNLLQLFFGWEAVGLVSYLLIGFWYTKPTAIYANLKAFLVNRVGDFGFILGIGLLFTYAGSMNYGQIFEQAPQLAQLSFPGTDWLLITVICICLFIGAMGKSAQFPLHVWLPDSMEGPTPISALIHAATMVTAGIFMVARMSPLFEFSDTALSFILVIGAITALFMGFLGIIQTDIKRVVAYSTLSQLGYMTVALGASAYSVAVFHLMTHAFFKALLFLAAGSVIIGMHHKQDIREMGGLWKYMPITWFTSLIGSLALIGTPFFSGFYSKDSIIEAVHASTLPGSGFAYCAVIIGVFVTAFYSFRMFFLVFHGKPRFELEPQHKHEPVSDHKAIHVKTAEISHTKNDAHEHEHHVGPPHESPLVITLPLILLAIPSLFIGAIAIDALIFGNFFDHIIYIAPEHPAIAVLSEEWHSWLAMALHGLMSLPFGLAFSGVVLAWLLYLKYPRASEWLLNHAGFLHRLLDKKYYLDRFNEIFFAGGALALGKVLWGLGDRILIDGLIVNGSARVVQWFSLLFKQFQSGFIYHYAFSMIIGILALMSLFVILR